MWFDLIHYHGTPLTPRKMLYRMAGKNFCVSFAEPRDSAVCQQIGQSVMFDNGAFSLFTQGKNVRWQDYYEFLETRLSHPHWAVIPDVIDGTVEEGRELIRQCPFENFGEPVWHMGLPIDYLLELADSWPRICFGSTSQFWQVGSEAWERRADEAFNALSKRHSRLPWIHMLRGLSLAGQRWPFASADSVNVAVSYKRNNIFPETMAGKIDSVQTPCGWVPRPEQIEFAASEVS